MRSIDEYAEHLQAAGRSPGTIRLRRYQIAAFLDACPDPTPDDVAAWLARPMNPETRASQRAALTSWARWNGHPDLVAGLLPVRRPPGVPRPCPDTVTAAALRDGDPATVAAVTLARFAGLRASEVAAVAAEDVDGACLRVAGKGGRVRCVPIHPLVAAVLPDDGFVFPARDGGHWRPGTITHRVSVALPGAWTCHSLRHAFATEAYRESGHDLRMVQELLGHASPATTARYVLVDAEAAVAVVTGMELAA